MTKTMNCITCPRGCLLTVEFEGNKVLSVSGNVCKRGVTFAEGEITRRIGFAYSADGDQAFVRDFIRFAARHRGRSLHKLETNSSTGE